LERIARDEHEPEHRRAEELVEDLPVAVHVVPDEIRLQRGDDRRDETRTRRELTPPDFVDDERGRDRNEELRAAHRPPMSSGDPVDEPEKPAVERLGVR
jgi:hypothetical protein